MTTQTHPAPRLGKPFELLWAATATSNLGDGISLVALPLLASSLTRDPLLIAAVAGAQRLPWLLFVLVSGVIVDRSDRRRLQQVANLVRAVVLGALGVAVLLGWASVPLLVGAALCLGIAETLFDNAAIALLPAVVARDDLERANGRLYTTQTIANEFVGPPIGGWLFALAAASPLLLVAACYGLAASLVSLLQGTFRPATRGPWSLGMVASEIREGLRWFWGHRLLHALGVKAAWEHGCWAATNAVLVLVVQERLGLGAAGYGLLLGVGALGGVLGGLSSSWLIARIGAGSASMLNLVIQAVAYAGIALSASPAVVALMLGLQSYTGSVGGVVGESFRQAIIPDQLMGRVGSAFRLYALGAMAVGAMAGGLLARSFGLLTPYWLSALAMVVLSAALLPTVNNRSMAWARQQGRFEPHSVTHNDRARGE